MQFLHSLLEKSAELYPRGVAVRYKNEEITYEELDVLSSKVCSLLLNRGVKENDRVGIYLDKSIDALAAIFGVLKCGACYVPLDTMAPPERNVYIIKDCSINCLITSTKKIVQIQGLLKEKTSITCIIITDLKRDEFKQSYSGADFVFKDEILGSNAISNAENLAEESLAYILYTSGSTGIPKGVMVTHRASLAFVNWAHKYFGIDKDEKVSAVAPFHFDLSIFDIFVTIAAGATICLIPQGMCGFPQSLAEFIERERINTWYSVPSVLIQLVLYGGLEKRDLAALKRIIFAGDVFPVKYLRELMRLIPQARYYNLYGPTETNVCTSYPVTGMPQPDIMLPIGKPCEGTEVFVLDGAGNTVGGAEIGELCVSGPTLMKGYWNDPQKTGAVLLKNFLTSSGKRDIYRTGDLVSMNEDGNLEFHGRMDNMVKSRGYRIELGEIESVLYEHPAIEEAAAFAVPHDEIGNKIKAAVVLKESRLVSAEELSLFCSKRLPLYMVPEEIIFKDYMPKTSTGKIDRQRLKLDNL